MTYIWRSLGMVLLASTLTVSAQAIPLYAGTESCATAQSDITSLQDLSAVLKQFGGLKGLIGAYRLGGLVGKIKKIRVELQSSSSGFLVRVMKDDFKQALLCADQRDPDVLRIRLIKAPKPENSLIFAKAGPDDSILLAADASDWKYHKFNRTDDLRLHLRRLRIAQIR